VYTKINEEIRKVILANNILLHRHMALISRYCTWPHDFSNSRSFSISPFCNAISCYL